MKLFLSLGALSGFIAVAAGAFGAHGLEGHAGARELAWIETGARYQMYHALALIAVAWLADRAPSRAVTVAGWSFVIGTLLFTGSLYVMGLTGSRAPAFAVPVGGFGLLIGWLALFVAVLKIDKPR
jgi:uncharacterized membrane protein YgdD (TMEM256/DUF423 family)